MMMTLGKSVHYGKRVLSLFTAILLIGSLFLSFRTATKSPAPTVTSRLKESQQQYTDAGKQVMTRALRANNEHASGMSSRAATSVPLKHEVLTRESQARSHFEVRWAEECQPIYNKSAGSSDRVNYVVGKQCWGACGDAIADAILASPIGRVQSNIQSWPVMQILFQQWGVIPQLAAAICTWICLPFLLVAIGTLIHALCMRKFSIKHIVLKAEEVSKLQELVSSAAGTSQAEGENNIQGLAALVPGAADVRAGGAILDKIDGYVYPQMILLADFQKLAGAIAEVSEEDQDCKFVFGMKLRTAVIQYISGGLALCAGTTYCILQIWFCIVFAATLLSTNFIEDTNAILGVHAWARHWVQVPMYLRHLFDMIMLHAPTWLKDLMILHPVTGFCNITVTVALTTLVLFIVDKLWRPLGELRKGRARTHLAFREQVGTDLRFRVVLLILVIAVSTLGTFLLTAVACVVFYLYCVSTHGVAWSCTKAASATMFGSASHLAPYYIGGAYNVFSLIHGLLPYPTLAQNVNKPNPSSCSDAWCIRDTWMSKFDIATNGGGIFVDTNTDVSQTLLFFFRGLPFYGMATCSGIVIQMAILIMESLRGASANVSFMAVLLQSDSIVYLRASWAVGIMLRDFLRKAAREAIGETYICLFVGIMALFCEPMETGVDVTALLLSTLMSMKSIKFGVAEAMELSLAEEEIHVQPGSSEERGDSRPFAMSLIPPNDYYARRSFKEKRHIKLVGMYRIFESLGVICTIVVCFATSSAKTTWVMTYCTGIISFLVSLIWWIKDWSSAADEASWWNVTDIASIQFDKSHKYSIAEVFSGTVVQGRKEGDWINLIDLCGYIHKDRVTKSTEKQDWPKPERYTVLSHTYLHFSKNASDFPEKEKRNDHVRVGHSVLGIDEGDGWLKVGDFFVPLEAVMLTTDKKHFDSSSIASWVWYNYVQSIWEKYVGVEELNGSWEIEGGDHSGNVITMRGERQDCAWSDRVIHRVGMKTFWCQSKDRKGVDDILVLKDGISFYASTRLHGTANYVCAEHDGRILHKFAACVFSMLVVVASLFASMLVIPACEILLWNGSITRPGARSGGFSFTQMSLQKGIWLILMWTLLLSAFIARSASPFNLPQAIDDIAISLRSPTHHHQVSALIRACLIFIGFVSSVLFAIIGKKLRGLHNDWDREDREAVDLCAAALSEAVTAVKDSLQDAVELVSAESQADLKKLGKDIGIRIWKGEASIFQLLAENALNKFYGSEDRMIFAYAQVKNLRFFASIFDPQDLVVVEASEPEGQPFENWQRLIGWHLCGGGFIHQVGYGEEIPKEARASILQRLATGGQVSEHTFFVLGMRRDRAIREFRSDAESTLREWITSESSTTCNVSAIFEDLAKAANVLWEGADPRLPAMPLIPVRDALRRLNQQVAKVTICSVEQGNEIQFSAPRCNLLSHCFNGSDQEHYTRISGSEENTFPRRALAISAYEENKLARRDLAKNLQRDMQYIHLRQQSVIESIHAEVQRLREASGRIQYQLEVVQMSLPVPNMLMEAIAENSNSPASAFIGHLAKDEPLTTSMIKWLDTEDCKVVPILKAALEPDAKESMLHVHTLVAKLAKDKFLTTSAVNALARAGVEALVPVLTGVLTPISKRTVLHDEQALDSADTKKRAEEDEHCYSILQSIQSLETSVKSRLLEQNEVISLLAGTLNKLNNLPAQRAILKLLSEGGSIGFEQLTTFTEDLLQRLGVMVRNLRKLCTSIAQVEQSLENVMKERGVPAPVKILNSPHPYSAAKSEHDSEITIPGAKGLQVIFSNFCRTHDADQLTLYGTGAEGSVIMKRFAGESRQWTPMEPITFQDADKISVNFRTAGRGQLLQRQGYFAIVFPHSPEASVNFEEKAEGEGLFDGIVEHPQYVELTELTNRADEVATRVKAITGLLFEVGSMWISGGNSENGADVLIELARNLVNVETPGVCTFLPRRSLQILSSGSDQSHALNELLEHTTAVCMTSKVALERTRALSVLYKCAATEMLSKKVRHVTSQIQERHRDFLQASHDVAALKRKWADQSKSIFDAREVFVHYGHPYAKRSNFFYRQVSIPSASSMAVFFATKSCTCDSDSSLTLRKSEDSTPIAQIAGRDTRAWARDTSVDGSHVDFTFVSDGYGPDDRRWGFFALVVPDGVVVDRGRLDELTDSEPFTNMAAGVYALRQRQDDILDSVSKLYDEIFEVLYLFDERDLPQMLQTDISELAMAASFTQSFRRMIKNNDRFPRELQESSVKTIVGGMLQIWLDDLNSTSESGIDWRSRLRAIQEDMPDAFKGFLKDDEIARKVERLGPPGLFLLMNEQKPKVTVQNSGSSWYLSDRPLGS